jgi:peptidoglycan/xylan/chitin deacetylase (PgdA/CDA1 family)
MMLETLAIGALGAAGWMSFEYAWWRPSVDWRHPRILMYHMVRPHRSGARFNKLRVPPDEFERQVRWLRDREFQFVFASQLLSPETLPSKSVCLTFDDGYEDNLTHADPVLERYGAVATLYLVADRSGGWSSKKKSHHGDEELDSEPKLSDEQVRSMIASGRWELGGHTRTHANLCALNVVDARDEITAPQHYFRDSFGRTVQTFAYPFGLYRDEHPPIAVDAGYACGMTTEPGIASLPYRDRMRLPRIKVSGKDNLLAFIMRMRGGKRGLLK